MDVRVGGGGGPGVAPNAGRSTHAAKVTSGHREEEGKQWPSRMLLLAL